MIKFSQVSKIYEDGTVGLEEVTTHIKPGEFVYLVGSSGAGKTTLLNLIVYELLPTAGEITVGERNLNQIQPWEIPYLRREVGYVFQDFKLLPSKTVFENVALALEVTGKGAVEIAKVVPPMLQLVGLAGKEARLPVHLSGGEKQKLAVARALVHEPRILLADEPTGMVDPASTWEIIELLDKVNHWGATVVVATHDRSLVDSLPRRVLELDRGRLVRDQKTGKYVAS